MSSLRATDNHEKKSRVERSFAVGTKSSPDASTCKSAVEYSLQKTSIIIIPGLSSANSFLPIKKTARSKSQNTST